MLSAERKPGSRHIILLPAGFLLLLLFLTVLTGWAQESGWPAPTYDESTAATAKDQLDDILSRSQYQWETEPESTAPSLWERIQNRLLDFLIRLLPEGAGTANAVIYIGAIIGAVLLAVVLALIARTFLRNLAADSAAGQEEEDTAAISAGDARKQADQLSAAGDYRSAVRYLYLSALHALDEHGHLRYDRARTNREYLRTVSGRPALAESLRQVVDVFDAVWYGYKPLDAATYTAYEAQVNHLRGLA